MSHLYNYTHKLMTCKAIIHAFKCPKFIETTKLRSFNIKNMILSACYTYQALSIQIFPMKLVHESLNSLVHSSAK